KNMFPALKSEPDGVGFICGNQPRNIRRGTPKCSRYFSLGLVGKPCGIAPFSCLVGHETKFPRFGTIVKSPGFQCASIRSDKFSHQVHFDKWIVIMAVIFQRDFKPVPKSSFRVFTLCKCPVTECSYNEKKHEQTSFQTSHDVIT